MKHPIILSHACMLAQVWRLRQPDFAPQVQPDGSGVAGQGRSLGCSACESDLCPGEGRLDLIGGSGLCAEDWVSGQGCSLGCNAREPDCLGGGGQVRDDRRLRAAYRGLAGQGIVLAAVRARLAVLGFV